MPNRTQVEAPTFLHGPSKAVRRRWRLIAKRAWVDGTYDYALQGTELVPVESLEGPVIIRNDRNPLVVSDSYWYFNVVTEVLPASPEELLHAADRQFQLVVSGMCHAWYCIGCLHGNLAHWYFASSAIPYPLRPADAHHVESTFYPLLSGFVRNLGAIQAVAHRIATGDKSLGVVYDMMGCEYATQIFLLAFLCGLITKRELDARRDIPACGLCDFFVAKGIAVPNGNGYALSPL